MDRQKSFLVLGLILIFTIFANCCLEREAFTKVDYTKGINSRDISCKDSTSSNTTNSNNKYVKSSIDPKQQPPSNRINRMVDRALQKFVANMKKTNGGKVAVPNFSMQFTTGSGLLSISGEFHAQSGVFSDLTTLRRKSDAIMRRTRRKITIFCAIGPVNAEVYYSYLNIVYGFMEMEGAMAAKLSPLTFLGRVSADYSRKPCVTRLEALKVSEMGPITAAITGSGIGALNEIVSAAVDNYVQNSYDQIREMIEVQTSKMIISRLPQFNCEQFRPK